MGFLTPASHGEGDESDTTPIGMMVRVAREEGRIPAGYEAAVDRKNVDDNPTQHASD